MPAPVCPHCTSPHTQTVKLMCLAATGKAETTGFGLGTFGLMGGTATSETTSQLAARFLPLPDPSPLRGTAKGFVAAVLGLMALFKSPWLAVALFVLSGLLVFAAWGNNIAARRERRQRLPMFERGWICMQCGSAWIPQQQ